MVKNTLVLGNKINEIPVGEVTVSVWTATDPAPGMPPGHHDSLNVEVGDGWVCVGGGGTGHGGYTGTSSSNADYWFRGFGNFLTASFPSDDFGSWNISSRDHINEDQSQLDGYAIGIKIRDSAGYLTKDELISNMQLFKSEDTVAKKHTAHSCSIGDGFLLLGGGFQVLDQFRGNLGTASFPDSTISWRACSKDHQIDSVSRMKVFAIGIRPTLFRANSTVFGNVVTTYNSSERSYSLDSPPSNGDYTVSDYVNTAVHPLPGFALCGGGAVSHINPAKGRYLWALEPTTKPDAIESDQEFSGRSTILTSFDDWGPITVYAMGIKRVT